MKAGLFSRYTEYEMHLDLDLSGVGAPDFATDTGATGIVASTRFSDPSSPQVYGVKLRIDQLRRNSMFVDEPYTYDFEIPDFVTDSVTGDGFASSRSMTVVFSELKLYWQGVFATGIGYVGTYFLHTWDECELFIDGVSHATYGSGSLANADWQAKSGVTLFGVQPFIYCNGLAGRNPPFSIPVPPGAGVFDVTSTPVASGGWRFKLPGSGSWFTPPVTPKIVAPLDSECPVGNPSYTAPTASNTYDAVATASAHAEYDNVTQTTEAYSTQLYLADNCRASIARLGDDNRVMVYRGGMPRTDHRTFWTCQLGNEDEYFSDVQYVEEHPMQAELLSVVGNAAHPIEDTFGYEFYAPYEILVTKSISPYGVYTQGTTTRGSAFPARTTFDGSQLGYYQHDTAPLCDYFNYWGSRHAQYLNWFPSDTGAGFQWIADGSGATPFDYWGWLCEQHLTHPALPPPEDRKTRNCMPSEGLAQASNGHSAFVQGQIFGNTFTSFVGVSRFDVREATIPTQRKLTSDSDGAWTFTDCTAVFGTDIVLSRIGSVTEYEAEYDASNFDSEPYYFASICNRLTVDWSASNIDSLEVYLVDSQDNEVLFCELSDGAPFTATFTGKTGDYYAGSWAQDYGVFHMTDIGTDSQPEGESSFHMSDERFIQAFQMWRARGFDKVRFKITPTDPTISTTLKYPTFVKNVPINPGQADKWCPESSSQASWLRVNGTGTRFGSWAWYDAGMLATPGILPAYKKASVVDALATIMSMFEATDPVTGVPAEVPNYYDSVEGDTEEDASSETYAFWLPLPGRPPTFALVNSFREMPNMSGWPIPDRDSETMEPDLDLDLVLKSWVYTFERRLYAAAGTGPVHVFDGADQWTTTLGGFQPGFTVTGHSHAVTGFESPLQFMYNGVELAESLPYHGFFIEPHLLDTDATAGPFCWQDTRGRYKRVNMNDTGVVFNGVDWVRPYPGFDRVVQVTTNPTDEAPRIFEDPLTRRVFVTFTR